MQVPEEVIGGVQLSAVCLMWDRAQNQAGRVVEGWIRDSALINMNEARIPTRKQADCESAPDVILANKFFFKKDTSQESRCFRTKEVKWSDHHVVTCDLIMELGEAFGFEAEQGDSDDSAQQVDDEEFVRAFSFVEWDAEAGEYKHGEWKDDFRAAVDRILGARATASTCPDSGHARKGIALWEGGPTGPAGLIAGDLDANFSLRDAQDAVAALQGAMWSAACETIPHRRVFGRKMRAEVARQESTGGGPPRDNLARAAEAEADAERWGKMDPKAVWKEVNAARGKNAWSTKEPPRLVKPDLQTRRAHLERTCGDKAEGMDLDGVNKGLKEKKVTAKPSLGESTGDSKEIADIFTKYFQEKVKKAYADNGVPFRDKGDLRRLKDQVMKDTAREVATDSDWRLTWTEFRAAISGLQSGRSPGMDRITHEMVKALTGTRAEVMLFRALRVILMRGGYPSAGKNIRIAPVGKLGVPVFLEFLFRPVSLCSVMAKVYDRILDRRASLLLEGAVRSLWALATPSGEGEPELAKVLCECALRGVDPQGDALPPRPSAIPNFSVAYRLSFCKELATILLIDFIMDNPAAVLLLNDCVQGFDVVDHTTMVSAFERFGAPASMQSQVIHFLSGRRLRVQGGKWWSLEVGKPQGSPLSGTAYNGNTSLVNREWASSYPPKEFQPTQYSDDAGAACTKRVADGQGYDETAQEKLEKTGKRYYQFYDAAKRRRVEYEKEKPRKADRPGTSLGTQFDGTYDFQGHAATTAGKVRDEFGSLTKVRGMRPSMKADVVLACVYPAATSNSIPAFPFFRMAAKRKIVSLITAAVKGNLALPRLAPSYCIFRGSGLPDPAQVFLVESLMVFVRGVVLKVWRHDDPSPSSARESGSLAIRPGPSLADEDFSFGTLDRDVGLLQAAVDRACESEELDRLLSSMVDDVTRDWEQLQTPVLSQLLEGAWEWDQVERRAIDFCVRHDWAEAFEEAWSYFCAQNAPPPPPSIPDSADAQAVFDRFFPGNSTTEWSQAVEDERSCASSAEACLGVPGPAPRCVYVGPSAFEPGFPIGLGLTSVVDDEVIGLDDGIAEPDPGNAGDDEPEAREGVAGQIFHGSALAGGGVNPIWTREEKPWTVLMSNHLSCFPSVVEEIRRERVPFGRKFWKGLSLDSWSMDRMSQKVAGVTLSKIRDRAKSDEVRKQVAKWVQDFLEEELARPGVVACATDGAVRTMAGDGQREIRGGAGAVVWYNDSAVPIAASKLPVLGVCGVSPDSFDCETVAGTMLPDLLIKSLASIASNIVRIYVVSDSESLLLALLNFSDESNPILVPLLRQWERIPLVFGLKVEVVFMWVPGHLQNSFNQSADYVAEAATQWGPPGTRPVKFASKTLTPSVLRRIFYWSTRHLRSPHSRPPSLYFRERFDRLGPFRPPRGLFRNGTQEQLYMFLWIGYATDGVLGMSRIRHATRPDNNASSGSVSQTQYHCALKTQVAEVLQFVKLVADKKPGFLPPHLRAGLTDLPPRGSSFSKSSKKKMKIAATLSDDQMNKLDTLAGTAIA
eukprot:g8909.t1